MERTVEFVRSARKWEIFWLRNISIAVTITLTLSHSVSDIDSQIMARHNIGIVGMACCCNREDIPSHHDQCTFLISMAIKVHCHSLSTVNLTNYCHQLTICEQNYKSDFGYLISSEWRCEVTRHLLARLLMVTPSPERRAGRYNYSLSSLKSKIQVLNNLVECWKHWP